MDKEIQKGDKMIYRFCKSYNEQECRVKRKDCSKCKEFTCGDCPLYNNGEGSKYCKSCHYHANLIPRSKTSPAISQIPNDEVENSKEWAKDLPMDKPFDSLELLAKLDNDEQATMFFQSNYLSMSHQCIADYHKGIYSRVTVTRMIQRAKKKLVKLYHQKKISFYYNNNL
jgi:hypothetical protein